MNVWLKYAITAGLVVIISEIAKRSDRLGALIASLPLISLLTLFWLYIENQTLSKISNHIYYTFWYVTGTLPFFLLFPYFINKIGFIMALALSILITLVFFTGFAFILKSFNVYLF